MTAPTSQSRWFRLTPGRLLPVLLAVEGFLWLSERFLWFPFNQHKGWTVLIAVASVGVFFLLMFLWFLAALVFRLRFQFGILSLLVLTVVVALPFAWLETEMKQAREQKGVVEAIEKAGGTVSYDYQRIDPFGFVVPVAKPPGPTWLRRLLGDDLFVNVTMVYVGQLGFDDDGMDKLNGVSQLQSLWLADTQVSDAGLEHLKGLTQLQWITLSNTKVSDAGLEHLKGLTQLQSLGLDDTKVGDVGLEHLKGLTTLQFLRLDHTQVSDAGLEHLKALTQLQALYLDRTAVSDAGMKYLKGLTRLVVLSLNGTKVTAEGVRKLQQALPNCGISH